MGGNDVRDASPVVPVLPHRARLLVTGFGPFKSYKVNSSELVVRRFAKVAPEGVLTEILPVDEVLAADQVRALVAERSIDAVIAFGRSGSWRTVAVERLGVNLYEDAGESRPLIDGGPVAYWSTLPVDRVRDAIRDTGLRARLSLSAGTYVCNALLYRLLEAGTPACFVHLPRRMPARAGMRAVLAAVEVVSRHTPRTLR